MIGNDDDADIELLSAAVNLITIIQAVEIETVPYTEMIIGNDDADIETVFNTNPTTVNTHVVTETVSNTDLLTENRDEYNYETESKSMSSATNNNVEIITLADVILIKTFNTNDDIQIVLDTILISDHSPINIETASDTIITTVNSNYEIQTITKNISIIDNNDIQIEIIPNTIAISVNSDIKIPSVPNTHIEAETVSDTFPIITNRDVERIEIVSDNMPATVDGDADVMNNLKNDNNDITTEVNMLTCHSDMKLVTYRIIASSDIGTLLEVYMPSEQYNLGLYLIPSNISYRNSYSPIAIEKKEENEILYCVVENSNNSLDIKKDDILLAINGISLISTISNCGNMQNYFDLTIDKIKSVINKTTENGTTNMEYETTRRTLLLLRLTTSVSDLTTINSANLLQYNATGSVLNSQIEYFIPY